MVVRAGQKYREVRTTSTVHTHSTQGICAYTYMFVQSGIIPVYAHLLSPPIPHAKCAACGIGRTSFYEELCSSTAIKTVNTCI